MEIKSIKADWIADCELNKTVGVWIKTDDGVFFGSAPQGTSDGDYEAVALPVEQAIEKIRNALPDIINFSPADLRKLDEYLMHYGGPRMMHFGANASVALSSAWAKMAAKASGLELYEYFAQELGTEIKMPVPCFNIINGGLHGAVDGQGKPYNPIQEIMLVPARAETFEEAYSKSMAVFKWLKKITGETLVGKEGGISPKCGLMESILKIKEAIEWSGYEARDFRLALDCAASEFFDSSIGKYTPVLGGEPKDVEEMICFYRELLANSPIWILSIEDPFEQNDFEAFARFTSEFKEVISVGDDLYATQTDRVRRGAEYGSTNAVLVKINQNGTVSGTLDTIKYGLGRGMMHMVSHRSKRAPNDFINTHLAIAVGQFIKHGSSRGERVEVYNELLRIEREAKERGEPIPYAGAELVR